MRCWKYILAYGLFAMAIFGNQKSAVALEGDDTNLESCITENLEENLGKPPAIWNIVTDRPYAFVAGKIQAS
jgi:hypothetical protein